MSVFSFVSSLFSAESATVETTNDFVSKWHSGNKPQELDTFRNTVKTGDIVQIKLKDLSYLWAICTRGSNEPQLVYRIGRDDFSFIPEEVRAQKGLVHKIGLDDLRDRNSSGFFSQIFSDVFSGSDLNSSSLYPTSANIRKRICYHIRINNSRDKITAPKAIDDVDRCVLAAVGNAGDDQFGPYDLKYNNDLDFVEQVRYPKEALDNRLYGYGCSRWYTAEAFESFSWLLKPGDMVEFNRKNMYSHWAVAVDRPLCSEVCEPLVHRFGSGDATEVVKKRIGKIMQSPFQDVINGSKFRINNSRDRIYSPKDDEDIRKFTISSISNNALGKYNVASNNCWHFAMQARYRMMVPKNMELVTEWYASLENIQPLLSSGDIIEFGEPIIDSVDRYQELAIYVERVKSEGLFASKPPADMTPEVAHLLQTNEPQEKKVVHLTSAENFFLNVARDKHFRINNRRDCMWKPKDREVIVKYVLNSEDKEDSYFVIGARYGKKAREEVLRTGEDLSNALAKTKIPWYVGVEF